MTRENQFQRWLPRRPRAVKPIIEAFATFVVLPRSLLRQRLGANLPLFLPGGGQRGRDTERSRRFRTMAVLNSNFTFDACTRATSVDRAIKRPRCTERNTSVRSPRERAREKIYTLPIPRSLRRVALSAYKTRRISFNTVNTRVVGRARVSRGITLRVRRIKRNYAVLYFAALFLRTSPRPRLSRPTTSTETTRGNEWAGSGGENRQ